MSCLHCSVSQTIIKMMYLYRTDNLAVEQVISNIPGGRAASPNSILDVEHRRRYTVIGGSTVDEKWYVYFASIYNFFSIKIVWLR